MAPPKQAGVLHLAGTFLVLIVLLPCDAILRRRDGNYGSAAETISNTLVGDAAYGSATDTANRAAR